METNINNLNFDDLVIQVNESMDEMKRETDSSKKNKISEKVKMILDGILSMNIFGSNLANLDELHLQEPLNGKGLKPYQIDAINLASDIVRAFDKTKEKFESEKQGKDKDIVDAIEKDIDEAKKLFYHIYNYHKTRFYRTERK